MSRYEKMEDKNDEEFRRQTGIERKTFERIVWVLRYEEEEKRGKGCRPNKLCLEDRILMWLEYLREYRTYFHIGTSRGISESACYRNIVWIENTLVSSGEFALPGRKELLNNPDIELVTIDATETPIQRPKKNSGGTIRGRKNATRSKRKSSSTRRI